jgi:ubiquitin carboxyl-terminal hydrolase 34
VLGKRAKDAAYRLLNSLIKKSPLLMNAFLEKSMLPLMGMVKRQDSWNYSPPGAALEGKQKYCGLKNLGCICYMNAMMQQFFMIPAFRYNLLSVDDGLPTDIREYKGHQIDDNVLHQLQKLMAHLELSERSYYDPYEFCFAFKDFEGNPTNTGEQKDAQEFLNMSFDRLETMLKGTSRKYLMQSVFGGQTCSQVVCLECGTCKNRIEDFYNLSLTVKDIKSMGDSLQKQIEGEVINEYECETCKKKVDISKRVLLSSSPNVLIVHLQRIIFNFDTFRNDKINSYFEFPNHLDLRPYSFYEVMKKEGRLDKKKKEDEEE